MWENIDYEVLRMIRIELTLILFKLEHNYLFICDPFEVKLRIESDLI